MFGLTRKEANIILNGPRRLATALLILQYMKSQKLGATCDDCIVALGTNHQTCSPRFSELEQSGCLVATGRTKKTRSGAPARLMRVASKADFRVFLVRTRTRKTGKSARGDALLALCESFLTEWSSGALRDDVLRKFLRDMLKTDQKYPRLV